MYYRLKPEYRLRGWKRLPYGILDVKSHQVFFMPREYYETLKLVAGGIEDDSLLFSNCQREYMIKMADEGILEKSQEAVKLEEGQAYLSYPSRFIRAVQWSVTGRCNYKCRHCYMSAPHAKYGELSHEACMDIVGQLAECGVQRVSLTGGEALVRKDFWEIVDALLEKEILITVIYSNGRLVTESFLKELLQRGIKPEINISFDGVGCHDWLRQMEGAEKEAVNAFRLCKEKGIPTGAEFCIHRGNQETLRTSVNLLASLGVKTLKVSPVMEVGEWSFMEKDLTLTDEEVYEAYLEYLPFYIEDGMPLDLMLSGLFMYRKDKGYQIPGRKGVKEEQCKHYCLCGHARNNLYITADGRMMPCMPMSGKEELAREFPKITELALKDALEDSFYIDCIEKKLTEYLEHNPECAACEYRYDCASGCRGQAAVQGNYLAPDKAVCTMFQGGYIERVENMMKKYRIKRER